MSQLFKVLRSSNKTFPLTMNNLDLSFMQREEHT